MIGKWDRWFQGLKDPEPFGLSITYDLAYEWLKDCETVEDWGCGKGWFSQYFDGGYVGVDGSESPFADVVADLTVYRSEVDGILLRHVLEHNYDWELILDNAVESARDRLCIILFTPLVDETKEITFAPDPGVPDISFRLEDLTDRLEGSGEKGFAWNVAQVDSPQTQYGAESIIRAGWL